MLMRVSGIFFYFYTHQTHSQSEVSVHRRSFSACCQCRGHCKPAHSISQVAAGLAKGRTAHCWLAWWNMSTSLCVCVPYGSGGGSEMNVYMCVCESVYYALSSSRWHADKSKAHTSFCGRVIFMGAWRNRVVCVWEEREKIQRGRERAGIPSQVKAGRTEV